MKINEVGRSMIEMLGVLAISGILGVQGIAVLGATLEKYRMDQSVVQISELIDSVYVYARQWRIKTDERTTLVPYLKAVGRIPDGMKAEDNDTVLKTSLGNYARVYINGSGYYRQTMLTINGSKSWEANIQLYSEKNSIHYCGQILLAVQKVYQESPKSFCYIYLRNQPGGGRTANLRDKSYNFNNLNLSEIYDMCRDFITQKRGFFIQLCFNN